MLNKFIAAAVQISPVIPISKEKTAKLMCEIIAEAADNGAKLVVFPECYFPMYPNWSIDLQNPTEWSRNLRDLINNSLIVPGPETELIGQMAKKKGVYVVFGANETEEVYGGALFNSLVYIGSNGEVIGKHRKLFPTNREKVFHARGDASGLKVYDTALGRIGGLICYEHLQPLLRFALTAQGEQIHCASWPGWPNYPNGRSNKNVIDVMTRSYALESQSFVILSSLYVPDSAAEKANLGNASWNFCGGSGIINPSGEYIAGPLYDQEGIVYGEIDLDLITLRKAVVDTTSRDTAWDVLNLNLNPSKRSPIVWKGSASEDNPNNNKLYSALKGLEGRLDVIENYLKSESHS